MASGVSPIDMLKKVKHKHVWSFHIRDLINSWESHMPVAELLEMNTEPRGTTSCVEFIPVLAIQGNPCFPLSWTSPHLSPRPRSLPLLVTLAGRHSRLHNARQLRNEAKMALHILLLIGSSEVKGNKTPNPLGKFLPPLLVVRRPLLVDSTASRRRLRAVFILGRLLPTTT